MGHASEKPIKSFRGETPDMTGWSQIQPSMDAPPIQFGHNGWYCLAEVNGDGRSWRVSAWHDQTGQAEPVYRGFKKCRLYEKWDEVEQVNKFFCTRTTVSGRQETILKAAVVAGSVVALTGLAIWAAHRHGRTVE